MTFTITKAESGYFRADCDDLPGSPPNGFGNTEAEALCHLFYRLVKENSGGMSDTRNWIGYINFNNEIIVNGKKWMWPKAMKSPTTNVVY